MQTNITFRIYFQFKFVLLNLIILYFIPLFGYGTYLLQDLDFDHGNWKVIGVPVYNYKLLPIQNEIGTFSIDHIPTLNKIKSTWNFESMYEDHCDYHYVLKFYKEKELKKTLKINLHCNYITDGLYSYHFNQNELLKYRSLFTKTNWCKVFYSSLEKLRKVTKELKSQPDVFFYHDVRPYQYDGFFVLSTANYPWNVDRDSVKETIFQQLKNEVGHEEFYIVPHLFFLNSSWEINFRFFVYINEKDAKKYKSSNVSASWRSHFAYRDADDKQIGIVLVGLNKKEYYNLLYKK